MEDKTIKSTQEEKQESIPKEEKKETPVEAVNNDPEAKKVNPILDDYYLTNPFFYEVANYFGIEQRDYDVAKDNLSVIVDYITQEYGIKQPEDILLKIRSLEDTIMRPDWGTSRYKNLYKYIRLASQKQSIQKAMKAFERSPNG